MGSQYSLDSSVQLVQDVLFLASELCWNSLSMSISI